MIKWGIWKKMSWKTAEAFEKHFSKKSQEVTFCSEAFLLSPNEYITDEFKYLRNLPITDNIHLDIRQLE